MKLKNLEKLFEELREPIIFEDLELDSMYNFTYKVDKGVIYIWDKYYNFNIDLDETRAIMAFDMAEEFGFEYKESPSEMNRIFDKIEKALREDLGKDFYLDWYTNTVLVAGVNNYKNESELNENKILTEGAINFIFSNGDLPTYIYDVKTYLTDEEALQMVTDYNLEFEDEDYSLDDVREWYEEDLGYTIMYDYKEVVKQIDEANYDLREFMRGLIDNLTDEEGLEIGNDIFYYPSEDPDYTIDELTNFFVYNQAIKLDVWDGYYQGFSAGIEVDIDDTYELKNKTSKKFIEAIIGEASKMLKEIADNYGMRRARSGGWAGPVYLEETKSKLNEDVAVISTVIWGGRGLEEWARNEGWHLDHLIDLLYLEDWVWQELFNIIDGQTLSKTELNDFLRFDAEDIVLGILGKN